MTICSLVHSTLQIKCGVCEECIHILCRRTQNEPSLSEEEECCTTCFGLLCNKYLQKRLFQKVNDAFAPYGGVESNHVSKEAPTISIPPAVMIRGQCAISAVQHALLLRANNDNNEEEEDEMPHSMLPACEYYGKVKERLRAILRSAFGTTNRSDSVLDSELSDDEEAGYLSYHVLITFSATLPTDVQWNATTVGIKQTRKRFRGNDPTTKQGGDPRVNLDNRVKQSVGDEMQWLDRNQTQRTLEALSNTARHSLGEWLVTLHSSSITDLVASDGVHNKNQNVELLCNSIHVAAWRHAFYVKGKYTKSRRDISQTPFFVPNDDRRCANGGGNNEFMKRLGVSSVEEQICPLLSTIGCGGISTLNNYEEEQKNKNRGKVVYGMCKFHASGREDMDVRMLLPGNKNQKGSGRPFVCEVIDAYRMPTIKSLNDVAHAINLTTTTETTVDEGDREETSRQYGKNPMGVGVSSLHCCSSALFRNLQSDTEDKVKFYGCVCWCERPIPSQEYLDSKLQCQDKTGSSGYPLEIRQSTPLRVLHRRSAAIRIRHVLTLYATRMDEHWFTLHLSTTAGTYVKEFVHGDCGRSSPSISSMLGGKTDILQLDCEGIAI